MTENPRALETVMQTTVNHFKDLKLHEADTGFASTLRMHFLDDDQVSIHAQRSSVKVLPTDNDRNSSWLLCSPSHTPAQKLGTIEN